MEGRDLAGSVEELGRDAVAAGGLGGHGARECSGGARTKTLR